MHIVTAASRSFSPVDPVRVSFQLVLSEIRGADVIVDCDASNRNTCDQHAFIPQTIETFLVFLFLS